MSKAGFFSALLLAVLIPLFGSAPEGNRPCDDDFQKYCSEAMDDREAMRECIDENMDSFSDECKADLKEMKKRMNQRKERREMQER